jgi:hypothetical protein
MLNFKNGGKPGKLPGEKPAKQGRDPTNNSTHI